MHGRPWRLAFFFSAVYMAVCSVYVWQSDALLGRLSITRERLTEIAQIKGILFVFLTSILLFAGIGLLLRQILRREEAMQRQKEAMLHAEERATAALFATSVAHDMNNILSVCLAEVDALGETATAAQRDSMKNLGAACGNLVGLARRLMNIGQTAVSSPVDDIDLERECRDILALAKTHRHCRGCTLSIDAEGDLQIRANVLQLRQAILNLFLNAAEAMQGSGKIVLRLRRENGIVSIEMHDSGPGIPVEAREKIFSAFYSTKAGGMGLGLLSVKTCSDTHQGTVCVGDSPLGGAMFRMTLPVRGPVASTG